MTQGLPPIVQVGQFPAAMQAEIDARLSTLRAPDSSAIAMITRSNTRIETDLLHALPNLRVIATCGVGVDEHPSGVLSVAEHRCGEHAWRAQRCCL